MNVESGVTQSWAGLKKKYAGRQAQLRHAPRTKVAVVYLDGTSAEGVGGGPYQVLPCAEHSFTSKDNGSAMCSWCGKKK